MSTTLTCVVHSRTLTPNVTDSPDLCMRQRFNVEADVCPLVPSYSHPGWMGVQFQANSSHISSSNGMVWRFVTQRHSDL
ncbi:unnamed protein product [Protopolystoma xenopodis]|uniref:Uncharacterized protein n=1 Tax=Protopolystoma xenopodis TaxID=117903 RepID=A0A3S5BL66_9PLAT|nr:unnamed protein product [Protopolystoma xenopodis]